MKQNETTESFSIFSELLQKINLHANNSVNPYVTFGIFGVITYPLYFFLWKFANSGGYENLGLRLIVCALCIPLIFHKRWPEKLQKFLALYWYFTLLYCLPFLFTFFLLKNNASQIWILNIMTVLILTILLLDTLTLSIILPLGALLGWFAYIFTPHSAFISPANLSGILITSGSVIAFGALFANRKDKLHQDKYQTMQALGATIAHELRNPLGTLNISTALLEKKMEMLLKISKDALKDNINEQSSLLTIEQSAEEELAAMRRVIGATFTFIDMLLLNLNPAVNESKIEHFSISDCIDDALSNFPFMGKQRALIIWQRQSDKDFVIRGEKLLLVHVLFNLLKNALYYVAKAKKGNIEIWLELGTKTNKLYFKDTGFGIPKNVLPHIFTRFFSQTYHGAGVGLTFCQWVMDNLGGKITCESEEGHYTLFTLQFPNNT
jgi:signal transduction histidine kinase